ncbi:MAG TPA: hypothetical protein DCY27_11995 [Desulfobacterales bacterium]|nr:hypothetical protein [Desulfobacterales bacterium]
MGEMHRPVLVLMGVLLLAVMGCNAEPPKIGVVDVIRVTNNSVAGKMANAELNVLIKAKQALVKEKAEAFEKLKKSPRKENAAAKNLKEVELNKAAVEYQKLVAASDEEIKKKAAELRGKIFEQMRKVLETIGKEDNFLLILTTENAPYFQKTIDISERVIKKYDEMNQAK